VFAGVTSLEFSPAREGYYLVLAHHSPGVRFKELLRGRSVDAIQERVVGVGRGIA
jgi:hypothetical protein